jgi:hypothetical protein
LDNFKIAAFLEDVNFTAELVKKCSELGYELEFPSSHRDYITSSLIVIDLNEKSFKPFELAKKLKSDNYFIFGLVNRLNKRIQEKATHAGIDLIFPKNMFCTNLNLIQKQVQDAKGV